MNHLLICVWSSWVLSVPGKHSWMSSHCSFVIDSWRVLACPGWGHRGEFCPQHGATQHISLNAASYVGVGPLLLSEGPRSLDVPEQCLHLSAGGRGWGEMAHLLWQRWGLALPRCRGTQTSQRKHVMVPGILRAGRQGTEDRSLGCAQAAPETRWGTAGNPCSVLCAPCVMTTLSAHLENYKFGDCAMVSGLLVLHSKGKNGGSLL